MFKRDAFSERLAQRRTLLSWWMHEHAPRFQASKFDQSTPSPAATGRDSARSRAGSTPWPVPILLPAPIYIPGPFPVPKERVRSVSPIYVGKPAFEGLGYGGDEFAVPEQPTGHIFPYSRNAVMAAAKRHLAVLSAWFLHLIAAFKTIFRTAAYSMLGVVLCGATLAYGNYRYWHEKQSAEFFLTQLAARVRPAVLSPSGELQGVLPPGPGAVFGLEDVGVDLHQLPDDYFRLLIRLEDMHAGKWWRGHIAGVDYFSIPTRILGGIIKNGKPGGASTLWMQAASLASDAKRKFGTVERKLREYAGAAEIYSAYDGDVKRVALAYSNAAAFARGMGGDVRGLVAAADIIFGVKPEDLTRGQSAILACAPNLPLILGNDSADAKTVFAYCKRRALDALRSEFGVTESASAIAEINAMGDLPPTRDLLENLPEAATGTIAGRTRALVEPLLPAIRADLNTDPMKEATHALVSR